MTYKQITDIVEKIADNHFQLKNIYFTKEFNIEDGEKEFPILHVYPNSVNYIKNSFNTFNTLESSITFKIYDLIDKENDNEVDVFSDTAQILGDFITMLSEHPDLSGEAYIVNSPVLTPIYQQLDSNANGWETIITIKSLNQVPYCQLPINQIKL